MKTANDLISVIPATNRDLENWVSRLDLATRYHQPERGHPRMFSRINAIELGMIAAFVRGGAAPSSALAFARSFVEDAKAGRLHKRRRWFVFPAADLRRGIETDRFDPDSEDIKSLNAKTLSMVDVRGLIDGIDALFRAEKTDA
ncbi:hypothetical protein [Bradyrhizobium japonicum]|uniref:hypothetical protein n=1 Tax=Bradyrhizobium japonicum TaxID=375 RepID=UPI0020A13A63|nr:hypothetical protein [Bradyrhizobium japonicum]MCP1762075.1 hypothetical protein [Bradyrhizobium japonicum]MCP1793655.1 hypothetical protein [Bradyrhizobium japonicum]MCP1806088.1 hypothetical protein [Bradyrhizobium japonicum]MCP1815016.1 hypothetical protein [Bradyrhizobium japonicum]MCP1873466.1 hypothetical protein [Bradyrhizobium japonicum]